MLNPRKYKDFNDVIAVFMDLQTEDNKWVSPINGSKIANLKYHSSWDWIMPVAEKILSLNDECDDFFRIELDLRFSNCEIFDDRNDVILNIETDESTMLLEMYSKCYQIIKWYNGEIKDKKQESYW